MRRLRYGVAMSLDGYIAGPHGEYDWIIMDPSIDFEATYKEFDTLLMGRRTFEVAGGQTTPDMKVVVVSRTLRPKKYPNITIVADDVPKVVAALKAEPGKDIWLFGGGQLFRSLLDAGLVDTIEVGVMPILLGEGVPVLPSGPLSPRLHLDSSKALPSGILSLTYTIQKQSPLSQRARRTSKPKQRPASRGRRGASKK